MACDNAKPVAIIMTDGLTELEYGVCRKTILKAAWNPEVKQYAMATNGVVLKLTPQAQTQIQAVYDGKPLYVLFTQQQAACDCSVVCQRVPCVGDCIPRTTMAPVVTGILYGREGDVPQFENPLAAILDCCGCLSMCNACKGKHVKVDYSQFNMVTPDEVNGIAGGASGGSGAPPSIVMPTTTTTSTTSTKVKSPRHKSPRHNKSPRRAKSPRSSSTTTTTTTTSTTTTLSCQKCQTPLTSGIAFCPLCGTAAPNALPSDPSSMNVVQNFSRTGAEQKLNSAAVGEFVIRPSSGGGGTFVLSYKHWNGGIGHETISKTSNGFLLNNKSTAYPTLHAMHSAFKKDFRGNLDDLK